MLKERAWFSMVDLSGKKQEMESQSGCVLGCRGFQCDPGKEGIWDCEGTETSE